MTEHPIVPPIELCKHWEDQHFDEGENYDVMLIQAYQAGADQELKECCEWIYANFKCGLEWSKDLHAARRPKPPSKKQRALKALSQMENQLSAELFAEIRSVLEELPDD